MSPRTRAFVPLWMAIAIASLAIASLPLEAIAAAGGGGGGGGGGGFESSGSKRATPADRARRDYERGLRKRDSAWKREAKAEEASSEKKRKKALERAQDDWRDAVKLYRKAIERHPEFHEAHSSLGYALRKLGEFEASIAAYDRALEIKPRYVEAIEYRGEAYLAVGRFTDAGRSYKRLLRLDREKAYLLLDSMQSWLDRNATSDEVDADKRDWLKRFVERERESQARHEKAATKTARW